MSQMFELHMVTFGERSYAHKIASFMDPDRRFFHDRILSRNEIFNPISKTDNLKALFPRGDLMVCIIDDREDVWNYARNLICVQPYVYFKDTGDINDPTKPVSSKNSKKRKMLENLNAHKKVVNNDELPSAEENLNVEENLSNILTDSKSKELTIDSNSVDSTSSSQSNDSVDLSIKKESIAKKPKISEKNKENTDTIYKEDQYNGPSEPEEIIKEINDDDLDDYLDYLEIILSKIHDEYYKIYENRIQSKEIDAELDEADLPDLKRVIPILKSQILEGVVITFSGVVPTDYDLKKQRCYLMAKALGAKVNEHLVLGSEESSIEESSNDAKKSKSRNYEYSYDESSSSNTSGGDSKNDDSSFSSNDSVPLSPQNFEIKNKEKKPKRYTTHLVAAKFGTSKVHEALKSKRKVWVVTPEWLINCNFKWERCKEKLFALTKEYEYKNCSFHNEYNMHQKYSTASAVSSKGTIKKNSTKLITQNIESKSKVVSTKRQFNEMNSTTVEKSISFSSIKANEKNNKEDKAGAFFTSETFYEEVETKNSDINLNEDLLDLMDKEVEDELDDISDFDENSNLSEQQGNTQTPLSNNDDGDLTETEKSSSMNSFDNDDDDFDIDDDMIMALEKNF